MWKNFKKGKLTVGDLKKICEQYPDTHEILFCGYYFGTQYQLVRHRQSPTCDTCVLVSLS
jgi:hypothetical protein